jgi:hypothetical protein
VSPGFTPQKLEQLAMGCRLMQVIKPVLGRDLQTERRSLLFTAIVKQSSKDLAPKK